MAEDTTLVKAGKDTFKYIVRIANTDLDGKKTIVSALKRIKGVGYGFANLACTLTGVDKNARVGKLSEEEIKKLNEIITNPSELVPRWMFNRRKDFENGRDKHLILGDLQFTKESDIRRLKKIKCYRGIRHALGLPVRGQRTRSNFRRNKGKGLGVIKKKIAAQMGATKEQKETREKK